MLKNTNNILKFFWNCLQSHQVGNYHPSLSMANGITQQPPQQQNYLSGLLLYLFITKRSSYRIC
jgi:hypothetical protein